MNGVKYGIDLPHVGIKKSGIGMDCLVFAWDDYLLKKRISTFPCYLLLGGKFRDKIPCFITVQQHLDQKGKFE